MPTTFHGWSRTAVARLEALALASLSLGAAAIHFAFIADHFAEYFLFGTFFAVIGWFQALWAVAYTMRPARWLAAIAIVANLATVAAWAWAHLVRLPFGPDPGQVELTTVTDLMATLFEVLLIVWLLVILARPVRSATHDEPHAGSVDSVRVAAVVALMVMVAIGTTVALYQPPM